MTSLRKKEIVNALKSTDLMRKLQQTLTDEEQIEIELIWSSESGSWFEAFFKWMSQ